MSTKEYKQSKCIPRFLTDPDFQRKMINRIKKRARAKKLPLPKHKW